jgi:hypothetical protein
MARCLDEIGRIYCQSGRPADASEPLEQAAELHEALVRDHPTLYGVDLARNRLLRASQRAIMGRPQEAAECVKRAEDVLNRTFRGRPDTLLYDMACSHCLWSAAGREGAIAPAEREPRARRAIGALREAVVAGGLTLAQVRVTPLLDPLRSRTDFRELIADLSFPADPFAP